MNIQSEISKLETVEEIESAILLLEDQRMKICNNIVITDKVVYVNGMYAEIRHTIFVTINKQTVKVIRSPYRNSSESELELGIKTNKGGKHLLLTNDVLTISGNTSKYYKEDKVPKYLKQFYLELCELRKKIYGK